MKKQQRIIKLHTNTFLMEEYETARRRTRKAISMLPFKERKPYEIEYVWTCKQIEDYGFKFMADHYIRPLLADLRNLQREVKRLPTKG